MSDDINITPIRPKELDHFDFKCHCFSDDEKEQENIRELLGELHKHYDTETEENDESIQVLGEFLGERSICS